MCKRFKRLASNLEAHSSFRSSTFDSPDLCLTTRYNFFLLHALHARVLSYFNLNVTRKNSSQAEHRLFDCESTTMSSHEQKMPPRWRYGQMTPAPSGDTYGTNQPNSGQARLPRVTTSSGSGFYGTSGLVEEPERFVPPPRDPAIPSIASPPPITGFPETDEESESESDDAGIDEEIARLEAEKRRRKAKRKAAAASSKTYRSPPQTAGQTGGHVYGTLTINGPNADVHQGNIADRRINPARLQSHKYGDVLMNTGPAEDQQPSNRRATLTQGNITTQAYNARFRSVP